MKLQQLRYLVAIVDNGLNITAASEALFTSQPGVSKQVRLLEEELSLQIFVRKGKSLAALTDGGQQVVERARRILAEAQNIKSLSSELSEEQHGELVIATTPTQARYVLPDLLESFQRKNPGVSLRLNQGTSEQIAAEVQSRDADFAIATGENALFEDLLTLPMYSWERIIVVKRDHPLAKLSNPGLKDIVKFPIISYTYSFSDESSLGNVFREAGVKPNVVFSAQDPDIIKTYVRKGMGIGILACMAYNSELDHDLVAINTKGLFPTLTTWVGFRKDRFLSKYMIDFLEKVVPGTTYHEIEQALLPSATDNKVVPFPSPRAVQDHPTFGQQFKNCCGGINR